MFAIQVITDESKIGDCIALIYSNKEDIEKAQKIIANPATKIYTVNYHFKGYEAIEKAIRWIETGTEDAEEASKILLDKLMKEAQAKQEGGTV